MDNLGSKIQSCPFCLKIGTHGISRMLILIPTLVSWISNPNFLFGQIWNQKIKVFRFFWKLARMPSWRCWFLFQHFFSEFLTLNPFLGKFRPRKSKLSSSVKIGTQSVSTMLTLILLLLFSVSNLKSFFGTHGIISTLSIFWGKFGLKKSKLSAFPENWHTRTYTYSISKMLVLSNFKPKSWRCWFLFWD